MILDPVEVIPLITDRHAPRLSDVSIGIPILSFNIQIPDSEVVEEKLFCN